MNIGITDEERNKRIVMVATYILETGNSTRETAKFFSDNFFPITNVTVYDYCKRYINKYKNKEINLKTIFDTNKQKTINDNNIRERVYNNAKLLLDGLTVGEISEKTKISYWVVYRDISDRLQKLDQELYLDIKDLLFKRKLDNFKRK